MSDVSPQAPDLPDTPAAPAAPDVPTTGEGHAAAETPNYEQRYNDLRSEFDRRNPDYTLLDRARQGDIDALQQLGLPVEFDDGSQEQEFDPDTLAYDPDALQAYIAQQVQQGVQQALSPFEQQQQAQQVEMQSAAALHAIDGFESLDDGTQDVIWTLAQALPRSSDGLYDVQSAYQQIAAAREHAVNQWSSTKPKGPAPGQGQAATDVPPNEDASPQELIKWAQERYRANQGHTA